MPVIMDDVRRRLFELIDNTPHLDWLLLTKRPQNIMGLCMWPVHPSGIHQEGMSFIESHRRNNVWLGTSVESQEYADKRIPELLKCRDLSPVLFLSCEPLVGPLDLEYPESLFPKGPPMCCDGRECGCMGLPCEPPAYLYKGIDWLITGGESGPEARPNHLAWFRSLRDQAERNHIPFHFKQWGEWGPESTATPAQINNASYEVCENGERLYRVGKKAAGRMLDGVEHNAFPESKI